MSYSKFWWFKEFRLLFDSLGGFKIIQDDYHLSFVITYDPKWWYDEDRNCRCQEGRSASLSCVEVCPTCCWIFISCSTHCTFQMLLKCYVFHPLLWPPWPPQLLWHWLTGPGTLRFGKCWRVITPFEFWRFEEAHTWSTFMCLFVCLFVSFFVCLFVCLFVGCFWPDFSKHKQSSKVEWGKMLFKPMSRENRSGFSPIECSRESSSVTCKNNG